MDEKLTIGIVGGMSPESTVTYYQHIIRFHEAEFHDHAYPRIVISSVSFQKYIDWQHAGNWPLIAAGLQSEFDAVSNAGADFAILATNTMHKVLPSIRSPIPVLSILDAVCAHTKGDGIRTVGLTGTKFTMSDGFYAEGLESRGLRVVLPAEKQQEAIHKIIYDELIRGEIVPSSVDSFTEISRGLILRGADAVLLGCTELELLTRDRAFPVPTIDSTRVHSQAAWEVSVGRRSLLELSNVRST